MWAVAPQIVSSSSSKKWSHSHWFGLRYDANLD
jgi:hypothetical protein